jgi:hypothetical protein
MSAFSKRASGIPRALQSARDFFNASGACVARLHVFSAVIARSKATKQSSFLGVSTKSWIASLRSQ